MQLQSDQLTNRLLKLSGLIQSNCQYLTLVRKCITDEQVLQRDNLATLQGYLQQKKCRINEDSFIQLFVQVAYFVFSCRRYNIKPQVGKEDIRCEESLIKAISQKKFTPVVYYKITEQKQLQPFQSIAIVREIYGFLLTQYAQYSEFYKGQMTPADVNFKNYMDKFKRQVQYLLADPKLYESNRQKQFFLCLQQTLLFRQYSILLRIKNCSILDLIKKKQANFLNFKECKQKDVELVIAYGNQKKKAKVDHDKIKEKQRQIQSNINQLFKLLSKNQTMEQQPSMNPKQQQIQKVKLSYKHKQKAINLFYDSVREIIGQLPQFIEQEKQTKKEQIPQMEYLIQYSSDRNSICVRLVPNQINVHIENVDFLMYQSNILTFQTVNVNIQLVQLLVQANNQKKTVKKLAFKGTSCLNSKQPPLEKILLLMDATMIAAKICQPQLNALRVTFSGLSDHERLNLVSNKINHYTRIYLRCAKKVYSQ